MSGIYQPVEAPPEGAILSRSFLNRLADNDRYFIGVCERRDPIPYTVTWRWMSEAHAATTIWDGWIFYDTDRDGDIHYWYQLICDDEDHPSKLRFYFNSVLVHELDSSGTRDGTISGPADTGLYPLRIDILRNQEHNQYNATAVIRPFYTEYTGPYSYNSAIGTFVDGALGNAGDFIGLCNNDVYFADIVPPQPAGQQIKHIGFWNEDAVQLKTVWEAVIPYDSKRRKIYFKLGHKTDSDTNADDEQIQVVWDADGASPQILYSYKPADGEWHELEDEGLINWGYTEGTYYSLQVQLYRTGIDTGGGTAHIWYMTQGPTGDISYTDPREYTVGQYVYGNTGGQRTALASLASTDVAININLAYRKYATRHSVSLPHPAYPFGQWYMHFTRRGDFLYYRGRGGKIRYAGWKREAAIPDCGTEDETEAYKVLDLNTVTGLHLGMYYDITGDMEFAMET